MTICCSQTHAYSVVMVFFMSFFSPRTPSLPVSMATTVKITSFCERKSIFRMQRGQFCDSHLSTCMFTTWHRTVFNHFWPKLTELALHCTSGLSTIIYHLMCKTPVDALTPDRGFQSIYHVLHACLPSSPLSSPPLPSTPVTHTHNAPHCSMTFLAKFQRVHRFKIFQFQFTYTHTH